MFDFSVKKKNVFPFCNIKGEFSFELSTFVGRLYDYYRKKDKKGKEPKVGICKRKVEIACSASTEKSSKRPFSYGK
jgi:hypothetical protein